jgi:hypothetical protein
LKHWLIDRSLTPLTLLRHPEWLVRIAADNARKAGLPLDWLAIKLKELENSEEADPYRVHRKSADCDLINQEREMKRQAKVGSRKRHEADAEIVAEPSTARAPKGTPTLNLVHNDNSPPPVSVGPAESSGLSFITNSQKPEYQFMSPPGWYVKVKTDDRGMRQLGKHPTSDQTQALKALQSMKGCMERSEKGGTTAQLASLIEELRDHVHKAEILLKVDRFIIRKAKMLEENTGLPRIFASKKNLEYPWDLKADAYQLYNRWREEIFEIDLLRGIKTRKGKDRGGDSIDPSWKGRFSAKYYGEGALVLGQWWPTQLTTVRDGAHGSVQGGIFGEKEKGAYSVVLSGAGSSTYDDKDDGEEVWYSGTDGKDFTPTENTLRLFESCDTLHNKIRVLRSHQLPKRNPYRPVAGLRYDGLYEAVEKKLVDQEKQSYKFRLVRCKGQFPIRCEDNAARRPTRFEIEEDSRLRKNGR